MILRLTSRSPSASNANQFGKLRNRYVFILFLLQFEAEPHKKFMQRIKWMGGAAHPKPGWSLPRSQGCRWPATRGWVGASPIVGTLGDAGDGW